MRFIERDPALSWGRTDRSHVFREISEEVSALRKQDTIRSDIYRVKKKILSELYQEVQQEFASKCAFCETPIDRSNGDIEWFRPPFGAQRENGAIDAEYYSWLVGDWENLYLCCPECSSYKKNNFPTDAKAHVGASINQLRKSEKALLLDPCFDRPERHFEIGQYGELIPKNRRATVTIKILNLNREQLCSSRLNVLTQFIDLGRSQQYHHYQDLGRDSKFIDLLQKNSPFVGAIYIYLWQWASNSQKAIIRRIIDSGPYPLGVVSLIRGMGNLPNLDDSYRPRGEPLHLKSLEPQFSEYRPIKRITISNFKGIDQLEMDFPLGSSSRGNSLAIVGRNASGKSTVLQALALALVGPSEANKIVKDARSLLGINKFDAEIVIEFWGDDRVNRLSIYKDSKKFFGEAISPVRVYAYGPYRLLAKRPLGLNKRLASYRVASLFDDGQRLNGYHGWLDNLNDAQKLDLAEVLQLLLASPETKVSIDTNSVRIETSGKPHPIESLSSGTQSMVSMCTDLMEALYANSDSTLQGSFVLLVDELDAHLHPSWRMGIVNRLTQAFPNAQLIFSTHDPLTLRGLDADQLKILSSDQSGQTKVEAPQGYSDALDIDQVLTSDIFGLFNTHAPDWEHEFNEYYLLLAKQEKGERLAPKEIEHLGILKEDLQATGVLGATKRERLMYAVIDKLLSRSATAPNEWDPRAIEQLTASIQIKLDEDDKANSNLGTRS